MKVRTFVSIVSLCAVMFTAQADKINLNKADVSTLTQSFKGIGDKRAQAIVKYRESHGGFKSVADLAHVRGLGQSFVNKQLPKLEAVYAVS